ncbi:MAG TPA: hypothetical protein VK591_09330 [Xanthobacteraceae bacterium]|nr:hypothetical protein [Xanthobacteraceae bacterium]
MRTFAERPQASSKAPAAKPATSHWAQVQPSRAANPIHHLQRAVGNQAALRQLEANATAAKRETAAGPAVAGFDFSRMPIHAPAAVSEKSVEGGEQNFIDDGLVERAPEEKNGDAGVAPTPAPAQTPAPTPTPTPTPAPAPAAPAKTAGVDSFSVTWSKHAGAGAADAKLRLDFTAKFKNDATHDPALAGFRQSVMSTWDITAGPNKGRKGTSAPMHDDHYSRADDPNHKITDVDFSSNDNPGYDDLDKDDVLDYSFTAQDTIIDTSQANKVIATQGPHTATVKGKHPRTYTGV